MAFLYFLLRVSFEKQSFSFYEIQYLIPVPFNVSVSCILRLVSVHSVMSDFFLQFHGLHGLLCPWNFPGKYTGVVSTSSPRDLAGLQILLVSSVHGISQARILELSPLPPLGIFLTWELNPSLLSLLHWQVNSVPLALPGKTCVLRYCLFVCVKFP